uniref:ENTH domain-containing protein n=1 Tax=Schistocephalus solidus TaxID=70667 RepID=A0A183S9V8_SCHSO
LQHYVQVRKYFSHLQKAINSQETPPKSKHVRAIILETFTQKSSFFLYSVIPELQVPVNEVACWKFLIVLHKVLRNGYEEFPIIPGDLQINTKSLLDFVGRTPDNQFTLCICLMDYLEILLRFQETVFANVSKYHTLSSDARQCQLVSLVQCIQDCAALYDLTLKTLIQLHNVVSVEALAGHRQRFNAEYYQLRDFFQTANRSQYFRDLLKIPVLPEVSHTMKLFEGLAYLLKVVRLSSLVLVDNIVGFGCMPS